MDSEEDRTGSVKDGCTTGCLLPFAVLIQILRLFDYDNEAGEAGGEEDYEKDFVEDFADDIVTAAVLLLFGAPLLVVLYALGAAAVEDPRTFFGILAGLGGLVAVALCPVLALAVVLRKFDKRK